VGDSSRRRKPAVNEGAAQAWFIAGTIPPILAGGLHALATLLDTVRPRFFAPIDDSVRSALESTGMRFRRMFPGGSGGARPSMWRFWLGFNISHGLGAFTFGLLCLLIATHDFGVVESVDGLRPLTIAVSVAYLVLSLRFWFYVPALAAGAATVCFTVATALSA
jgi:hypothetical protein